MLAGQSSNFLGQSGAPGEEGAVVGADFVYVEQGGTSQSGGDAIPGIRFAGESVEFRIAFVYNKDAAAPPLNVSPVLDDVTLTYRAPLKVLVVKWGD